MTPTSLYSAWHHVCLPADNRYANDLLEARKAAEKYGFKHLYDMGTGNGHIIMLEKGHVRSGYVYVGADSHSTIYGALGAFGTPTSYEVAEILLSGKAWFKVPSTVRVTMEAQPMKGVCARDVAQYVLATVGADGALMKSLDFSGSYIHSLSIYQRMIFSLLSVEMGAITGFIEPDEITRKFMDGRVRNPYEIVYNDPDCVFEKEWFVDVSKVEPMIACPPRPALTERVADIEKKDIKVHQAYIGGCTGSSVEDFEMAAEILRGRSIYPTPGSSLSPVRRTSPRICASGFIEFFTELELSSVPLLRPCRSAATDTRRRRSLRLAHTRETSPGAPGSTAESTLPRLYTVAASAICGKITDPRRFL